MHHSREWIRRQMERLDLWNGRQDGQEAAGGLGFAAGLVIGMVVTMIASAYLIRGLLETCAHG